MSTAWLSILFIVDDWMALKVGPPGRDPIEPLDGMSSETDT
jgi:hypothetical protein